MEMVYLYVLVMYLFGIGFFINSIIEKADLGMLAASFFLMLLSPVTVPVTYSLYLCNTKLHKFI